MFLSPSTQRLTKGGTMQLSPPDAPATAIVAEQVDKAQGWATGLLDYCMKLLTEYGFRVLGAIVVMIVVYVVAGWTKRGVLAALTRAHLDPTIAKFTSNMSRYAVLVLGL